MAEEWDQRSLEDWLSNKPVEVSVAIASRAALRVLPMVAEALDREHKARRAAIVLPALRANAVALTAGKWPLQRQTLTEAADASDAGHASRAATAASSALAAGTVDAARIASGSVGRFNRGRIAVFSATSVKRAVGVAGTPISEQVNGDIAFLRQVHDHDAGWTKRAEILCRQPLWRPIAPDRIDRIWYDELRPHLRNAGEGWEVWTDWYDSVLAGHEGNEALEVAKALIPDRDWRQGPAHVNAIIARLIRQHTAVPNSGRLRISPDLAKIERTPEPIGDAARHQLALDRVRERLKSIEQAGLGNQHSALESILSELRPTVSDTGYTAGQVHGRYRSALRMIERAIRNGLLPEDDDVVDNLVVDLGDGIIDLEASSDDVKEAADQYRAARMQTPAPQLAERIGPATDAFVEAADKPEGDLAREGGEAFEEVMARQGPDAPVTDPAERATIFDHAWRLIRTARLKLPDKETRDKAVGLADRWGKVGKAIELAGSAVVGLLSWLARFL